MEVPDLGAPLQGSIDLKSKNWFLTYPQSDILTKESILTFLETKGTVVGYVIGQEEHQDGHQHFHVLVSYEAPLRVRNARYFDIEGRHPNIVSKINNLLKCWNYCRKDNVYLEGGIFTRAPDGNRDTGNKWGLIREGSTSTESLLDLVKQHDPRSYYLYYDRIEANANKIFKPVREKYISPPELQFTITPQMQHYLDTEFIKIDRPKTLVLAGRTRLGKTLWARSLG